MPTLLKRLCRFVVRTDGPTTVEYTILLALLVGMMAAGITYVGDETQATSDIVVEGLDQSLTPSQ